MSLSGGVLGVCVGPAAWLAPRLGWFWAGWRYAGAGVRATARARISQFADANRMWRWLRFLARPR